MATKLSIDPKLIEQAKRLSGEQTKTGVITKTLHECIARPRRRGLRDLMGKVAWAERNR